MICSGASSWRWVAVAVVLVGCTVSSDPPAPEKVEPKPGKAQTVIETPAGAHPTPAGPPAAEAEDEPIPELTEEELALIAADPADLTVEQRRKRAYARRKKIMQDPNSPTARALKDLAEAHQAGDLDVGKDRDGMWFHARGTKPTHGRPPAGWRPPEDEAKADSPDSPNSPGGGDAPVADGGASAP